MDAIKIGVTSPLTGDEVLNDASEARRHLTAVEAAGGEPILLRITMDPLSVIQEFGLRGIVFSGGGDVSASQYGGNEILANEGTDPRRDAFEIPLMKEAFGLRMPILAVCRGMQLANVVLGGTLIEDLRNHFGAHYRLPHRQVQDADLPRDSYAHEITITPGTVLHELAEAERISINSFHHQAIAELAPPFRATAHADDGVIEAIEFSNDTTLPHEYSGFFIGVQWHPEGLTEDRLSKCLYADFVNACRTTGKMHSSQHSLLK